MNLQTLKLKASTLCAGGTLLVFGGFLTVNLAGCGGGGGGGLLTTPTPSPVGATFRIVQQDSTISRGGSLTLTGNGQTYTGTADNTGVVVLNNVAPGDYTATFTAFTSNNIALPSTTRPITITRTGAQSYLLVQGDTGNGKFSITGTIFQNPTIPPDDEDPTGNTNSRCASDSVPITAAVLISVRDLNDTTGAPIIAQILRPAQDAGIDASLKGRYAISLPINPRSFRIEVTPLNATGTPRYAGISATTTFVQGVSSLTNVNVCVNDNGSIPIPFNPTPTPTNTPFGNPTLTPTVTSTMPGVDPLPTNTPNPTSTAIANATATAVAGATATAGPNATATAVATTTFTQAPGVTPVASATPII